MSKKLSRRDVLRLAGFGSAAAVLAACQPRIVEVEKVVTKEVEKEVIKEVEKEVIKEVEKEVTRVVEKVVEVAKPTQAPVTITYWGYATGSRFVPGEPWGSASPEAYVAWQKETFEKLYPHVTVETEMLKHDATYFTKIDAGLMAGTQPDIVMGPVSEAAKYIVRNVISPIDEFATQEDLDDWSPAAMKELEFGGKHYLWPWRLSYGGGIAVNGKILEERGVRDRLPQDEERKDWTPLDYLEIAKACTFDQNDDGVIDVYGSGLVGDWTFQDLQFLYGFGADFWNDDESAVIINSDEGIAGMKWMNDLEWVHGCTLPGTAANTSGEVSTLWKTGKVAMFATQGAGGSNAAIEEQEAKGTMEFIFCMPPSLEGEDPGVMTNMHGYYVFVNEDKNRLWWAHEFSEHLVRPEAIALCVATGKPPVRESFWGQVGEDPNMKVGVRMVNYMRSFGRRPSAYKITFVLMAKYFSAIFSRQMSEKEGLDRLADEATKLLQKDIEEAGV